MATYESSVKAFNRWRAKSGESLESVANAIGDPGWQIAKWSSGGRPTLSLRLKVRLSLHTSVPLERLLDADELSLARQIAELMGQDAAA